MRLTYQHMPYAGTIIGRDPSQELKGRFLMIQRPTLARPWNNIRPLGSFLYYTMDITHAEPEWVYTLATGGIEPRSIMEYYILRRKWTPYGFAKVWGHTTPLRTETIPIAKQVDALRMPREPRSAAKARRRAVEKIRQEYHNRVIGASNAWKQRSRQNDTPGNANL